MSDFVGSYEGTFSGDDTGTWEIAIRTNGKIAGSGISAEDGPFSIKGNIDSSGGLSAIAGSATTGATWAGEIADDGSVRGTWENKSFGDVGTFEGSRHVASADLIWQDIFDRASGSDEASGIAALGFRTFVVGTGPDAESNFDFLVRAYNVKTGELLWSDAFDQAGDFDEGLSVVAQGTRVFATGIGTNAAGNEDGVVRAYNAKTGRLLWDDRFDVASGDDFASSVVALGRFVFVAGAGTNDAGNQDFLVRAYSAAAGNLLWEDEFDLAGGEDIAETVAALNGRVVATGFGTNAAGDKDFLIRAYDARTGDLLWQDQLDRNGGLDAAEGAVVRGKRVFVEGVSDGDGLLRAYDVRDGRLLWQDRIPGASAADETRPATTPDGRRVVWVGVGFLVRTYDAATGDLLWQNQGQQGAALQVAATRGRVFAVGTFSSGVLGSAISSQFVVRTFDAKTGQILWQDQFGAAGINQADAVVTVGNRVLAAGFSAPTSAPATDFLVRAYDARGSR